MRLSSDVANKLQLNAANIRNICVLAHVDHGKTSLSDSLLATNGIISQRMAGKVRYLDSREDEQQRGITMEASAISLYFKVVRRKDGSDSELETHEHLINLIDSPGHIDFSSEVSTSSRLCDGAVVLVDVVEGVCSQTVNVLRQCWLDKLKPLLVLNKVDRLITEWQLTPMEAYQHLSRTIEQVNVVIGSFFAGERMEDDMLWRESGSTSEFVEKDDAEIYFSPEKNNVIFASAVDGWAFSINTFAKVYAAKLGFSHSVLTRTLWGDFFLDMKNKKIVPKKKAAGTALKPLFVSLVLDPIWQVYQHCYLERNQEKLDKIVEKLGVKVLPRDLRSKDFKSVLTLIMSQWIPISHALLGAVIDYLPSPQQAQQERMKKILKESATGIFSADWHESILACDSSNPSEHTLAYISKLISIPEHDLPKEVAINSEVSGAEFLERSRIARELARKALEAAAANSNQTDDKPSTDEILVVKKDPFEWEFEDEDFEIGDQVEEEEPNTETLVAFTRVYAGSLSKGQLVTIVGPNYNPVLPQDHPVNKDQLTHGVEIKDLFLIMGRELVRMDTVPAGNIVGVVGLDQAVLKNATICSTAPTLESQYINLASTLSLIHNKPIMKVAVEPANLLKLAKLEKGLDLLAKADPVFEWYTDEDSGELIVCVAGELHLERCLKDLEERFAKSCEVTVKEPVIPFREGLAPRKPPVNDNANELRQEDSQLEFQIKPLPISVTKLIIAKEAEISDLVRTNDQFALDALKKLIVAELSEYPESFAGFASAEQLVDHIICFGPKRVGPNLLVESAENGDQFSHVFGANNNDLLKRFKLEKFVCHGFQLAANEGPLAQEPLQGVLVILKRSKLTDPGAPASGETESDDDQVVNTANIGGPTVTSTRDQIHKLIMNRNPRLFLATYTCDIQALADVLGKVYAVVQKRGGTITSEEMKEGTPFFTITAKIPVIEGFGFSEEMRKKTLGAASPQLVFDGYDMLDIDPFWVPHTEEELEELGEFAERENVARRYMNTIRRRKGLFVDEKMIKNAEKQRTMRKD